MAIALTQPLCIGSSGADVCALQTELNAFHMESMPELNVDGSFDRKTHLALIAYQRQKGLKADGIVETETAKALGWEYNVQRETPYLVVSDKPPMHGLTPPITVVAEAIRVGISEFTERILDDVWESFSRPSNELNYRRLVENVITDDPSASRKRLGKRILMLKEIVFYYTNFVKVLGHLGSLSEREPDLVPIRLQSALAELSCQIHAVFTILESDGSVMETCRKRLNGLPSNGIVGKMESVLKGERSVHFAVMEVRMLFQTHSAMFVPTLVDRPTVDWLDKLERAYL